jgi:hypothetical protein
MIIKINKKSEFIKYCKGFEKPVLVYGFGDTELLSFFWLVKDNGERNRFLTIELPGVRLSKKEYLLGNIDACDKRRHKKHDKYINWMCDLFIDHYDLLFVE